MPEYRGQGAAASLMLQWAADFADEHGLASHIDTVGDAPTPHTKLGWEKRGSFEVARSDGKMLACSVFVREPKRAPVVRAFTEGKFMLHS